MKNRSKNVPAIIAAVITVSVIYFFTLGSVPESDTQSTKVESSSEKGGPKVVNAAGSSIQNAELRAFIDQFYSALHGDDFETVSTSFAKDAIIFENGIRETSLPVYLKQHLKPEMAVMKSARRRILVQEAMPLGDRTLITTSSLLSFSVEGKQLNFHSVETLALVKKGGRWLIQHAHWSSRPVQN